MGFLKVEKEISDYSDFVLHQMCQDHKRLNKLSLKVQSISSAIRPSHLFAQPEDISSSAKLRKLEEILPRLQVGKQTSPGVLNFVSAYF